jgi:hypothetical protein
MTSISDVCEKILDKLAVLLDEDWSASYQPAAAVEHLASAFATLVDLPPDLMAVAFDDEE